MAKEYMILKGDCLDRLKELPENSIDSVITDPPYGLSKEPDIVEVLTKWMNGEPYDHGHDGFMGKSWDSFVPHPDIWREVYRVLKPGGHALVFAGTRTQDLMTIALRLAGFEVRDVIEWLYFNGFPKSLDVSKAFDRRAGAKREVVGKGKYFNKQPNGLASCNVTGFSSEIGKRHGSNGYVTAPATELAKKWDGWGTALKPTHEPILVVRKPLEGTVCDNVEKYGTGAINIDACRISMSTDDREAYIKKRQSFDGVKISALFDEKGKRITPKYSTEETIRRSEEGRFPANIITTEPDAFWSKYCNVAPQELSKKASKCDRNSDWCGAEIALRNTHPTVKPTELMAWLVRLVTPPGGTVLDPFAGSGSTLVAAKREGFGFIGIELMEEYITIAEARTGVKADNRR